MKLVQPSSLGAILLMVLALSALQIAQNPPSRVGQAEVLALLHQQAASVKDPNYRESVIARFKALRDRDETLIKRAAAIRKKITGT